MQSDFAPTSNVKPPVLFWMVAVLSLIWNAIGAYDYVMTNIRDADYIARFPPEVIHLIDSFPVWVTAAWALGVWGAVAGSVLLLLRSRYAVHAFGVSLLGLAASTFYQFGMENSAAMGADAITIIIWIVAVLLLLYSFRWRREGLLR